MSDHVAIGLSYSGYALSIPFFTLLLFYGLAPLLLFTEVPGYPRWSKRRILDTYSKAILKIGMIALALTPIIDIVWHLWTGRSLVVWPPKSKLYHFDNEIGQAYSAFIIVLVLNVNDNGKRLLNFSNNTLIFIMLWMTVSASWLIGDLEGARRLEASCCRDVIETKEGRYLRVIMSTPNTYVVKNGAKVEIISHDNVKRLIL